MVNVTLKEMLDAGLHFGHRTQKWNPKMKPYIYTERSGIHILDLTKTASEMEKALRFLYSASMQGKEILFVSTKLQSHGFVQELAIKTGNHYITNRWLGGFLTNFATIKQRIKRLKDLRKMFENEEIKKFAKKEQVVLKKELDKLENNLGGVANMHKLPDVIFVVDMVRDNIAVREAKRLGIQVVGFADTNADPDILDYMIPANDDAVSSLALVLGKIKEVILQARKNRPAKEEAPKGKQTSNKDNQKKEDPKKDVKVAKENIEEKGDEA